MRRGEVRWYRFSRPDKRLPIVILTRSSILEYLGEVTVAPITRTIRDIPSEVVLTSQDGMAHECAVNCDHLQTVSRLKVEGLIATLDETKMVEVSRAVRFALNL
ncbi:MAG: type II toxin-antitoxin system PemK/MazF family toxin [Spirochaetes bacterium]|nr:type II toxin-antitoxin system PemK/MazF family toxin [Spirochaetota bacterium]